MQPTDKWQENYQKFLEDQEKIISKTAFFDALGDAVLAEFIALISAGDQTAMLFDYRIKATGEIDINHLKTKAGLQWMQDSFENVPPGLLNDLGWL